MTYNEAVMLHTDLAMLIEIVEELAGSGEAVKGNKNAKKVTVNLEGKMVKEFGIAYGLKLKCEKIMENESLTE